MFHKCSMEHLQYLLFSLFAGNVGTFSLLNSKGAVNIVQYYCCYKEKLSKKNCLSSTRANKICQGKLVKENLLVWKANLSYLKSIQAFIAKPYDLS